MQVNIYDFDYTIYDGDSSKDFYKFCLKKKKTIILYIFPFFINYILYRLTVIDKDKLKTSFFAFLKSFNNIDDIVISFWEKNEIKIKKFYLEKNHTNDIIITASPEFLVRPISNRLKVKDLIGSIVDKDSGVFLQKNCKGVEKVNRLYSKYNKKIKVISVYSDSYSDQPLFDIGENNYLVKGDEIVKIK